VNIAKLKQRLEREAKKNPKQVVVLGILLLVALWFWAPLVWKWLPSDVASPSTAAGQVAVVPTPGLSQEHPAEKAKTSSAAAQWQKLVEWMKHDPLMTPATQIASERDPFTSPVVQTSGEAVEVETNLVVVVDELTPERAGLVLTSTIVGPKRRAALISGRAYAEGRKIVQPMGQQLVVFKLTEVHPKYIVLERDQHRYELKLAESTTASAAIQFAPADSP